MSEEILLPNTQVITPEKQRIDRLLKQVGQALLTDDVDLSKPIASNIPAINLSTQGIATVKRYRLLVDHLITPDTKGERPVNDKPFLSDEYVSEADLVERGCNIRFLISTGQVIEDGYMQI